MRYRVLSVFFATILVFSHTALASTDNCSLIPGFWAGEFTAKNPADCEKMQGCTHPVAAITIHTFGINYRVDLKPQNGKSEVINITCQNGKVTSPVNPGNIIKLTCAKTGACLLSYEDEKQTVKMINANKI